MKYSKNRTGMLQGGNAAGFTRKKGKEFIDEAFRRGGHRWGETGKLASRKKRETGTGGRKT